jgi:hypothetical protein
MAATDTSTPAKRQKRNGDDGGGVLWNLAATLMSGKAWQFEISFASTLGELRRRVMLASGSWRKIALIIDNTSLDDDLAKLSECGLYNGAGLSIVVSEAFIIIYLQFEVV